MNRLQHEISPYLLQHAENPVDWYPWCTEAFEAARREDKPVFLSIGYSTCHWCHVMAHESFEDAEVAALLNAHFICIKVDKEERPDVDSVYMRVCEAYTGSAYGEDWRCGLIDQEGRVVAPLRYTCVEADADGTLRLSGPDGAVEIFRISEAGD